MRVILIRHAETDGNKLRYVGREDLLLNQVGRQQVLRLADALRNVPIDLVLASPLARAVSTAQPIADQRKRPVEMRPGLMEVDYGDLQGNLKGGKPFSLRREYLDTPMPGGESLRDVWHRLQPVADEIFEAMSRSQTVAVAGHYWSNRMLAAMLRGAAFKDSIGKGGYKPSNASAYALEFSTSGGSLQVRDEVWLHGAPDGN